MPTHCAVPLCSYSHKTKSNTKKRSLFTIKRPDLGRKTSDERKHYENLTKFILSMRDAGKGDIIKGMLHKESAAICEVHFHPEDIILRGDKQKPTLRLGAIPCLHLPKPTALTNQIARKPPLERVLPPPAFRYKSLEQIFKASSKLSETFRDNWKFFISSDHELIVQTKLDENLSLSAAIKIVICCKNDDAASTAVLYIRSFTVFGWPVPKESWPQVNIMCDTLHQTLATFDATGKVEDQARYTVEHPVLRWTGTGIETKLYHRSFKCSLIAGNRTSLSCEECEKVTTRNLDNESTSTYCNKETWMDRKIKEVFGKSVRELNEWQLLFFENQVKNAGVHPAGRRYHPDVVRWCIELYCRSSSAYKHIRDSEVLFLPAPSTIATYRNNIPPIPGVSELAIKEVERVMNNFDSLPAYLTVDEMTICQNIVMKAGKVVGFVDEWAPNEVASKVLVYYRRSIKKEISLPIAWYPTTSTHAGDLAATFWEVLNACECRSVNVHALVEDGFSSNRKMFKLVSGINKFPLSTILTAVNPYNIDCPIFLCSDVSHLLKTVRNALYSSKPGGEKFLNMTGEMGKEILWTHVAQLYNIEKNLPLTVWTKLTNAHIHLTNFSKMKVHLAKGVMSWKVGKALSMVDKADGTAQFILMFDRWYDIMSCNGEWPIYSVNDARLTWLKEEFIPKMHAWEEDVRLHHKGEKKRMMARQTHEGVMFTTYNFISLTEQLLKLPSIKQLGRYSRHPDLSEAAYGIQHVIQRKSIKKITGGNTKFGCKNSWTAVSHEPI